MTAGTVFQGTRMPLKLWFIAAWDITAQKYGASALGVKRVLGVESYETAWSWLDKLRRLTPSKQPCTVGALIITASSAMAPSCRVPYRSASDLQNDSRAVQTQPPESRLQTR